MSASPAMKASQTSRTAARRRQDRHGPKYQHLRQLIIEQIATGKLKPGDPLPTERWLAETNALARNTVRQAMRLLEQEGLISRMQGIGTFVQERARERLRRGFDLFALVLPETQTGFYPSLQHSFDQAAWLRHHQLIVCNTDNNVDRQASVILQLMDKQVAGVALVPVTTTPTPAYHVRQLQKSGIPVVLCHRPIEGVSAPLLEIPFHDIGRLVARRVAEQGHRRVALFSTQRNAASHAVESGLRAGLSDFGAAIVPDGCYFGPGLIDPHKCELEVLSFLKQMLDRDDRPTVIFSTFDSFAELTDVLLARLGLRVPEDISLVGVGGTTRSTPLMQRLTSATVDEVEIGRLAAELLDQMRRGELPLEDDQVHQASIGMSSGQTLGRAPAVIRRISPSEASRKSR